MKKKLAKKAIEAKEKAYAPYSNFKVGAALLTENGKIYTGANIENVAFSPTICAERNAIFTAVHQGEKKIKAIAIASDKKDTYPCGVCRQVMREFSRNLTIYIINSEEDIKEYSLKELFPYSFSNFSSEEKDEF